MQADKKQRRVLVPTDIERASFSGVGKIAPLTHLTGTTMGTHWSLHAYVSNNIPQNEITSTLEIVFKTIIRQMSTWDVTSQISRYNRLPSLHSILIDQEFQSVLARAIEIAAETNGAFNPAIGQAVNDWGFGPEGREVSNASEIASPDLGTIRALLDGNKLTQQGGLVLDLSSIAKGYTLDMVATKLRAKGINSFLFEIGGEFIACGVKPDAQPWWVEIETPPKDTGLPQTIVALCDLSLATSGAYKRYHHIDGKAASHLINPYTGTPCDTHIASVSVLHKSCMDADAYATALYCMGSDRAKDFAETNNLAVLFQFNDGTDAMSTAMQAMLE